jgi:thiamine transport system substrate-binding protein
LSRIRLEGARTEADVVLGLDTNLTAAAAETGLFAEHGIDAEGLTLPMAWDDPLFLPFRLGVFRLRPRQVASGRAGDFEALAASDISIVIQDPRSSTPGLGLLLWVEAAYGDRAGEIWAALADNIVTVTPGLVGGLWPVPRRRGGHGAVYTTSPAYHLIAEEDPTKAAAASPRGITCRSRWPASSKAATSRSWRAPSSSSC